MGELQNIERSLDRINDNLKEVKEAPIAKNNLWVARLVELDILLLTAELFLIKNFTLQLSKISLILSILLLSCNILLAGIYFILTKGIILHIGMEIKFPNPFWWFYKADRIIIPLIFFSTIFLILAILFEMALTL